jgi:hypothetical protein
MPKKKQNKKFDYIPAEHMVEQEQEFSEAPTMESYNPMEDDGDLPYIPSMPQSTGMFNQQPMQSQVNPTSGFIDVNNIQNYSNTGQQQQNQMNPNMQFNQNLTAMNEQAAPNFNTAQQNIQKLTGIMGQVNEIAGSTDNEGNDVQRYAYSVAMKSLHDTIKMLKEIDYWIPPSKEEYAPALKQISAPIIKALTAYVTKVESLK